jgi:predicted DNA-binding antitoxin AbrB/MazE fold protein
MPQAITVVYENGVFIPKGKINLPEHTTVRISIPTVSSRKKKPASIEALFDIATGGPEADVSVNHDTYLYGETHR